MSDTLTDAEPPSLGRSASRGAVVTLAGQGVRIVVQLLGIVILARLLSPKDYGLIASVTAIIGVAETFRDFGLSSAAIQAKSITRAQKSNLFWINSSIGLGLALIVCACSPLIAGLYGQQALQSLTLLLSISFFFNGVSTQFRADLNRNLRFLQLSMVDIFAQILGLSVGIAMALGGFGFWSLAGQQVSQDLFQLILVVILTKWFPGLPSRGAQMGGFLKFGLNLFGVQLLQYVSRNVASVVIGSRLGPVQLGLYNRAFQLMLLPLNQINAPSTRVALPVLSRLQDDAKRFGDFISFGQTVMLNLVTFILAFCGAQAYAIISISIGSQWLASVPIFQVLLIAAFFQTAGYVMYWIFLAKGLTKANLIYSVATWPLMIVVIIVGANWGVMGVAWAYALSITVVWPLGLLWISKVSDAPAMKLFLNGLRTIVIYGFATIVSYVSTMYLPQDALILRLVVGFVALVAALGLVALVWLKYRSDLKSMLDARRYFGKGKRGVKPAAAPASFESPGTPNAPGAPASPSTRPTPPTPRQMRNSPDEQARKTQRRLQKLASSTFTSSGLSATLDRAVFRIAGRSAGASGTIGGSAPADDAPHVLLAPPGGGNIGDQAMVESFLENTDGRVVIIVRSAADIVVPPAFTSRVKLVELSALLYRDGIAHLRDVRRYHSLVSRARSVSVVGADIMDGLYSLRASVRRSNAAELAASLGVDTRILGFSWNGTPKPAARAALVKATRAGAVAMLRDPASAARARQQGVQNVADVADTVFAARTVDETIVSRIGLPEGVAGKLVIVNASGLIAKKLDQLAEYETIIARLRAGGRHVLLLPHVSRPLADDAVTCRAIFERVGSDGVTLVDRLLQPAEIRGLTSIAEFVITGRMHLAIQAMYNGKPAITLSTQGKVEGLMQLFASEDLAVEPVAGFSAPIGRVIDSLFSDGPGRAARITDALPHVSVLSRSNFERISAEPATIES